jgi:hypothetical protein
VTAPTTTREAINAPELYGAHVLSNGDEPAAHIVDQREASGQDVAAAYILGDELVALCGRRWVPTRDPKSLPLCRACVEVLTS